MTSLGQYGIDILTVTGVDNRHYIVIGILDAMIAYGLYAFHGAARHGDGGSEVKQSVFNLSANAAKHGEPRLGWNRYITSYGSR